MIFLSDDNKITKFDDKILFLISGKELSVKEIVDGLEACQPNVSARLNRLKKLGKVESRKEGRKVFYKSKNI